MLKAMGESHRDVALAVLGAVVLALGPWGPACDREVIDRESASILEVAAPSLEPLWGRCVEVRGTLAPLCVFDPEQPLRLWLRHEAAAEIEARVDGEVVIAESYRVEELLGIGLRVPLAKTARRLEVRVPGAEPWTLQLRSMTEPDDAIAEVVFIDDYKNRADDRFYAGTDHQGARALAEQGIKRALRSGLTSRAIDVALMTAYYLELHVNAPDAARDVLERVRESAQSLPQWRAAWESRAGLLLWHRGDLGEAVLAFRTASQLAMQLEDDALVEEALTIYATTLAELGYFGAALHWSRYALDEMATDSPHRGEVLEMMAWVNLVLRHDGHPHVDPVELYRQAATSFAPDGPFPDARRFGAAVLGLAEAYMLDGRPHIARTLLDGLGSVGATTLGLDNQAFRDDLELRVGLTLGLELRALQAGLARLARSAEQAGTPEARWWLAARRGDVFARAERWTDSVTAYREAEGWLDEQARYAALGVGRAAVGARRRESTLRLAEALLELEQPAGALCALREAEGRRARPPIPGPIDPEQRAWAAAYKRKKDEHEEALQGVESASLTDQLRVQERVAHEREELRGRVDDLLRRAGAKVGRTACNDLDPRHDGELLLGIHPAREGWLVLTEDDQGTTAYRLPDARIPRDATDRAELAKALLEPIAEQLGRAKRLRVLATDVSRRLDVQVLPWHGRPLLEAVTVVHGAEVATVSRSRRVGPPRAVLVADPTRSLPGAVIEITSAATTLRAAGFSTDVIEPHAAWPQAVGRRIAQADLLHFAGHSRYPGVAEHGHWPPYDGGTPATASHLVLAGEQSLAVHDILLLESVPEVVILEGCEAGALDPIVGGTSLALAFVAKGAREVIASPEPLRDELATVLGQRLYTELPSDGRFDAAAALRAAQSELWDAYLDPEAHLGRYRVWVP